MNKAQQKMLEQIQEARGVGQGCVHLDYSLEGQTVQLWDTALNAPAPHQPPFKVLCVYPAKTKGYLIVDLEINGKKKSLVPGFNTTHFFKVVTP